MMAISIHGIVYLCISRDATQMIITVYCIQTVAVVLYLLLIPESPRWLLLQGFRDKGIDTMNWIAFVNGSNARIP